MPGKSPSRPVETLSQRRQRTHKIIILLRTAYPSAACSLRHDNPWQLLVATILSAQCTDVRVNQVTPALFQALPTPAAMAQADLDTITGLIRSLGFVNNKAKALQSSAQTIVQQFHGHVPDTMDQLTSLRGVGRKTANVVLGNAFNKSVGIVVDTHVARLSRRLALTPHTDPAKIEQDLLPLVPPDTWTLFSHLLIFHGRALCTARKPRCAQCPLLQYCPTGKSQITPAY